MESRGIGAGSSPIGCEGFVKASKVQMLTILSYTHVKIHLNFHQIETLMDATAGNSNRIEWNGPHAHGCSCSPNFSRHMDSWSISSMSAGWWIRGAPNKNILNPYLATWPLGERGIHVGNCHKPTVWEWFIQIYGDFGAGSHWLSSIHPGAFFHPAMSPHRASEQCQRPLGKRSVAGPDVAAWQPVSMVRLKSCWPKMTQAAKNYSIAVLDPSC